MNNRKTSILHKEPLYRPVFAIVTCHQSLIHLRQDVLGPVFQSPAIWLFVTRTAHVVVGDVLRTLLST